MAGIIPPEYFGLFGLGETLKGVHQDLVQTDQRKRVRTKEEFELFAALNPNDPVAIMRKAEELGLAAPGSSEGVQLTPQQKLMQGVPWEELSETERFMISPSGMTPDLATRGATAGVEGAEQGVTLGGLQIDEARAAAQRRQEYETTINTPTFRALAGLPKDMEVTPGSIEAIRIGQGINAESLDNMIREARAQHADEREIEEINNLRRRNRLIDLQIKEAQQTGTDDGTLAWMKDVAQSTGLMPTLISQAMDPASGISDEVRNTVIERISEHQESRQSAIRKTIRENTSEAVIRARELIELNKATEGGFLAPDNPYWLELGAEVLTELGVPVITGPEEGMLWWKSTRTLLGEEALSYMEQLADMVGADTSQTPTIDANSAAAAVPVLIEQFGDVDKALEATRNNENITDADRDLFIQALTDVKGSEPAAETETPATPTTPEPEATYGSTQEAITALEGMSTSRPGRSSESELIARELRTIETAIEGVTTDIQTRTDRMIEQQSRGLTTSALESSVRSMEDRVRKLEKKRKELLRKAYRITNGS